MKVLKRGDGEPEYSIVGSLHGDEPAGKEAIENFLASEREYRKPVQFIVANEKALEKGKRFVEDDLNRVFPGDPGGSHEESLAAELLEAVEGTEVLDIHTTKSYPLPFATFSSENSNVMSLAGSTGVTRAVHMSGEEGVLTEHIMGVTVEAGFQGTKMAQKNAEAVIENFLISQKVIGGKARGHDPVIYEMEEKVEGDWNFTARNFSLVREGEVYAEKQGEKLRAEEDFYPVLMSSNGYEEILGFKAKRKQI